jgi:hypothetical protein
MTAQEGLFDFNPGDDLSSHTVTRAVSSGPARLHFRVRDGDGCDPRGVITGKEQRSDVRSWMLEEERSLRCASAKGADASVPSWLPSRLRVNRASGMTR